MVEQAAQGMLCLPPSQTTRLACATTPPFAGFSVYGSAPRGELLSKAGLQPGQALILTKPIGTGRTCRTL